MPERILLRRLWLPTFFFGPEERKTNNLIDEAFTKKSPSLTYRAIVWGSIGSVVLTCSSMFIALRMGALPWPAIFAAIAAMSVLKALRKTSLDELPQLINIIKGDMSVVGPRPALWNQYDLISARDRANINKLYPGLTGLAQVMGRDELPIPVKVKYDIEYANNMSFSSDFRILLLTVKNVLSSKGVKEGGVE